MKFALFLLLAFIVAIYASPVKVSDNNIGDIVTVAVNAKVELDNHVNQDIISVIAALINQQALVVALPGQAPADSS